MTDDIDGTEPLDTPDTPIEENNVPAPEVQEITENNPEPEDKTEPVVEGSDTPEPEPKKTAWYMREIGSQRERNQSLKAQNEALLEQLASLKGGSQPAASESPEAPQGSKTYSEDDIDRIISERAQQLNQVQQYTVTCNNIYDSGTKEFQDFDESVKILGAVGVLPASNMPPTPLMQMVTDMPDAHKILYQLSQDPDKASQLLSLPIAKQALELAKMQQAVNAPKASKPISSAPAPIKPLNGIGKSEPSVEKAASMKEYLAARNKERGAKGKPLFNV